MTEIDVRLVGSSDTDPAGFEALYGLYVQWIAELEPDDPAPSRREVTATHFVAAPDKQKRSFLATINGDPAGFGTAETASEPDDELQVADVEIYVKPASRRRGVADALAARLSDELDAMGQNSVLGWPCCEVSQEPAKALCHKHGLVQKSTERCSRANVADIDTALMQSWIDEGEAKAVGYRLEQWIGLCPEEFGQQWSQAEGAMADEPHGLDWNPYTREAEAQRQSDRLAIEQGLVIYRTLCLAPDGSAAGLSSLCIHEDRPQIGHQLDTAVLSDHRGRGIGRWMKAANLFHSLKTTPDISVIQTFNNEANPWMLDINVAMGFTPYHQFLGFQGPVKAS